jgi:hypothetical protein
LQKDKLKIFAGCELNNLFTYFVFKPATVMALQRKEEIYKKKKSRINFRTLLFAFFKSEITSSYLLKENLWKIL